MEERTHGTHGEDSMKWLGNAIFALLVLAPAAARGAGPEQAPPAPPPHPAAAPRDTTRFLPPWLRPWLEFGGGWMAGPSHLKQYYESGQAFASGIEARPGPRWALRTALDYQMLVANNTATIYVLTPTGTPGVSYVDTVHFQTQTTGWVASLRTEAGVRLPSDFWLTAGAGGGYMHSGLAGDQVAGLSDLLVPTSGAVANGWGWLWTAALRYDFTPAPRVPLGLDVRTIQLRRDHDAVQLWSVRLCLRMPADPPPGSAPPPHDGRGRRR
jgi:hypothetical protein